MHRLKVNAITRIGEYLLSCDVCPAAYLRNLGLPPAALLGNELWLDRDQCFLIAENLRRVTGDPIPGIHVAESQDLRGYGLWSDRILAADTLGDALLAAVDNIGLIETGRMMRLRCDGHRAFWETDFLGHPEVSPREYLVATAALFTRFIELATEDVTLEVHLAHEQPTDTSEYERVFGPNLVFDADLTALVLDRDALELPMDHRKIAHIFATTNDITASHVQTAAAAAKAVQSIIAFERPTAAKVAEMLGMNVRTMQRHLGSWGVTFEELLQDFRLHHALIGLTELGHSVTDVAFELGYSDSAHFTRAFRRWTGTPPSKIDTSSQSTSAEIIPLLTQAPQPGTEATLTIA